MTTTFNIPSSAELSARSTVWALSASDQVQDYVAEKQSVLEQRESSYSAVLIAVFVLIGVFAVVSALYLYLCLRSGYSSVSASTRILKKWGVPYGVKAYIYCR